MKEIKDIGLADVYEIPRNNGMNLSVEQLAREIIESGGLGYYWAELALNIDGHKVNIEAVVTYVDDIKYGEQFIPKELPKWKALIKRLLSI